MSNAPKGVRGQGGIQVPAEAPSDPLAHSPRRLPHHALPSPTVRPHSVPADERSQVEREVVRIRRKRTLQNPEDARHARQIRRPVERRHLARRRHEVRRAFDWQGIGRIPSIHRSTDARGPTVVEGPTGLHSRNAQAASAGADLQSITGLLEEARYATSHR